MSLQCYAQRLLNPFRGVMNVIRYQSAEAVTTDGINWEIYVSNDALLDGLSSIKRVQISDIRYGSWSEAEGLRRGPIFPSEDFKRLERMGAIIYEALPELHKQLPYAFTDHYELWLLDVDEQPLALIHSVCEQSEIETDIPVQWRAGNHCQKYFKPELDVFEAEDMTAAEMLMLHVNTTAGYPLKAKWFQRDSYGAGHCVACINAEDDETTLPDTAFSKFFINAHEDNTAFKLLLDAFIVWQAPWLLLLPTLTHQEREYFEQQARQHALMVDAQFRLYPEIIDEGAIKGARVEAMMRKNKPEQESEETILSTWYLELGENERGK